MRKDKIISEVLGEEATITPSDLYNMEFKSVMFGGYDKDEVDRVLERLGDVFESLQHQIRDLKLKIEEQRGDIDAYRAMEQSLRNALTSSQKASENIVTAAKREAEAILEEARIARRRSEFESRRLPEALEAEIRRLREARDRLRDDLGAVLSTHIAMLERIESAEDPAQRSALSEAKEHYADDPEEDWTEADGEDPPEEAAPFASAYEDEPEDETDGEPEDELEDELEQERFDTDDIPLTLEAPPWEEVEEEDDYDKVFEDDEDEEEDGPEDEERR